MKKTIERSPFLRYTERFENTPVQDARQIENLFLEELKNIHGAEKHQFLLLPLLKKAASSLTLQTTMARCLDNAREHACRLEEIFSMLRRRPGNLQPEIILGLSREAEKLIATTTAGTPARDAGLIMVAQQVKQYEISSYGYLAQLARNMEQDDILDILEDTLNEERETDDLLTALTCHYNTSSSL